jgi:hypothetical protein
LYFTNRQDRYAHVAAAPQLAGYLARLAGVVGEISYTWARGALAAPAIGPDPAVAPAAYKAAARSARATQHLHTHTYTCPWG